MTLRPITVLLAHEPRSARRALRARIDAEADLVVTAEAETQDEVLTAARAHKPSIVLMDLQSAKLDGNATTRALLAQQPVPIVLVTTSTARPATNAAMESLRSGALAVLPLPLSGDPSYDVHFAALMRTLRSMARVVFRHAPTRKSDHSMPAVKLTSNTIEAIGIVASTGGPGAVATVLSTMTPPHPPVLLVQHMSTGFVDGFCSWLEQEIGRRVVVATHGEKLEPSTVYVAPEQFHMGIDRSLRVVLSDAPPVNLSRPSGTWLLRSMALALGRSARAAILTGMGSDGADGAVAVREAGGMVATQDQESSTVYGMPQQTALRGGSDVTLPLEHIGPWLCTGAPR